MPMRLPVVHHAFAVEIRGNLADAFVRQGVKIDVARIADFPCGGFPGAGVGSLLQARLDGIKLRVHEAITPHLPGIEHTQRGYCLEPFVGLGGIQCIAATAADTQSADMIGVYAGIGADVVGHAVDVLRAELRLVHIAGSPLTGSLIGSVRRDGDIAFFCQPLGIKSATCSLTPPLG